MSGIDDSKVAFLWQHEHGTKWITYPEDHQDFINKAFNKGQKTVTLPNKDPKKQIVLKFDKMFQKNKVSGWEQHIRCCVYDKGFYVWQWKDEDGYYNCYIPGACIELEACFKLEKNAKLFLNGDYEVDLKKFSQQNVNTGTLRDVKREKVKIEETPGIKKISETFEAYIKRKCEIDSANASGPSCRPAKMMKLSPSDYTEQDCDVPVDEECKELFGVAHVLSDTSGVYDAVLNQTNLQFNNNKYYRMQLLKENSREIYYVWYRWGRVGGKGQRNLIPFHNSLHLAKEEFQKKFQSKTSNSWLDRKNFVKVSGKYDLLKMKYSEKEQKENNDNMEREPPILPSKLPAAVHDLIKMISDGKIFATEAFEMKYDVKKYPLGKLNTQQIKDGWLALNKIESILKRGGSGSQLVQACSEYYTRIPHNFGMKTPPVISSISALIEEMKLLQVLSDAEVAFKIKKHIECDVGNPIDSLFESLKCDLTVLSSEDDMYKMIEKYMLTNHGPTHTTYKMKIINVFSCHKASEDDSFKDYGNRYLLWHGSRLTNFVGILKNGLQIAPPEAPATGYMFGKGLYFADVSSKSANYCYPTKQKNEGLVLLCEVSLGEENILYSADYNADEDAKKKGKQCVKGMGRLAPDPRFILEVAGMKIPLGKAVRVKDSLVDPSKYELNYNEYIVYNTCQVKLKYLIHLKFLFV